MNLNIEEMSKEELIELKKLILSGDLLDKIDSLIETKNLEESNNLSILEKETDIKEAARKVLAVKDIITNNEMSFHYLLSYFELWDYYFIIENTDTYNPTIPKRIEDKQLVRK